MTPRVVNAWVFTYGNAYGVSRSNFDRQVDVLGEHLGMRYRTWFPNVDVRGGGSYGNAVLSKYPIVESTNIDLSIRFKKRRSVLHAVCRVRHDGIDRSVHVFNVEDEKSLHLTLEKMGQAQAEAAEA